VPSIIIGRGAGPRSALRGLFLSPMIPDLFTRINRLFQTGAPTDGSCRLAGREVSRLSRDELALVRYRQ
jgi:hypothetical protein